MLEYSVSDLNLPLEHSAYSTSSFVSNSVVVAFGETKEQGQTIYKDKIQVVKTNGECNTLHAGDQEARSRHASVEMDGKLLLLGGKNQHQYHSSLLLLDIQKDELVNRIASHEAFKRTGFSATAIDQKIFLFGGTGCSANPTDVTMYDVTADRCINMTTKGEFPELSDDKGPRFQHFAFKEPRYNYLMVYGGCLGKDGSVYRFDVRCRVWSKVEISNKDITIPWQMAHRGVVMKNQSGFDLLTIGGLNLDAPALYKIGFDSADICSYETVNLVDPKPPGFGKMFAHSVLLLPIQGQESIVCFGGYKDLGHDKAQVMSRNWVFRPYKSIQNDVPLQQPNYLPQPSDVAKGTNPFAHLASQTVIVGNAPSSNLPYVYPNDNQTVNQVPTYQANQPPIEILNIHGPGVINPHNDNIPSHDRNFSSNNPRKYKIIFGNAVNRDKSFRSSSNKIPRELPRSNSRWYNNNSIKPDEKALHYLLYTKENIDHILQDTALLHKIFDEALSIIKKEPSLIRLQGSTKIFGDIHGQYDDLMDFFHLFGYPVADIGDINKYQYVFLGDFVDRGEHSLEVIITLLSLKCKYPKRIHLLRGNHEDQDVNTYYGFKEECEKRIKKGGDKVWKILNELFAHLPLGCLIEDNILCIHGGIGPRFVDVRQLNEIKRPISGTDELLRDVLWSDPMYDGDAEDYKLNPERGDKIYYFSQKKLQEFLAKNNLSLIIRAHQVVEKGFELSNGLLTLFSATNYLGRYKNKGAIAIVDVHRDTKELAISINSIDPKF